MQLSGPRDIDIRDTQSIGDALLCGLAAPTPQAACERAADLWRAYGGVVSGDRVAPGCGRHDRSRVVPNPFLWGRDLRVVVVARDDLVERIAVHLHSGVLQFRLGWSKCTRLDE
jgi:hypothetical protein